MSPLKVLSANLRDLRAARGLTQEKTSEKAGLSVRHYQQIEAAERPGLQVATVARLAKAFSIETWELLQPGRGTRG